MRKLNLYCTTIKFYEVINNLPSYIKPVGLGDGWFPRNWLSEKNGKNISHLNKYYGELSGFYWVWQNCLQELKDDDLVGFCHYRKLWLNREYLNKQKSSFNSLYSKLLDQNNDELNRYDVFQISPIKFSKKNLFNDFVEIHKSNIIEKTLDFLDSDTKNSFKKHLNGNTLFPLNMFIATKKDFRIYCEKLFPWLEICLNYCKSNNILNGYNIRMPAFLAERFTSFWFSKNDKRTTFSYARLGSFFLNNHINRYINTLKIPFTFRMYPTIHYY